METSDRLARWPALRESLSLLSGYCEDLETFLQQELESLEDVFHRMAKRYERRLEADRSESAARVRQAEERLAEARSQLEELRTRSVSVDESYGQSLVALESRCGQLQKELEEARRSGDDAAGLKRELDEARERLREAELSQRDRLKELDEARRAAEGRDGEVSALQIEVERLQAELARAQRKLDEQSQAAEQARTEAEAFGRRLREASEAHAAAASVATSEIAPEAADVAPAEPDPVLDAVMARFQALQGRLEA